MSSGKVKYELDVSKITLREEELILELDSGNVTIAISDIVGCQTRGGSRTGKDFEGFSSSAKANVLFIVKPSEPETYKWTLGVVNITGEELATSSLVNTLQGKLQGLGRPQKLLVFLNPVGGNHSAKKLFADVITPLLQLAGIQFEVLASERANHMTELAMNADLTGVQGVMVLGGDGTLGEVINGLVKKKQGSDLSKIHHIDPIEIPLGIMPTGTANVMCRNIHGTRDLTTAVLHVIKGGVVKIGLNGVYNRGNLLAVGCWSTVYGLYSDMMYYNDRHRWMRKFRALFVTLWFFLFKAQRLFDAKVTYQLRAKKSVEERPEETECIEKEVSGRYLSVMSMNANVVDDETNMNKREDMYKTEEFSMFCYRQAPRFGLISQMAEIFREQRDCFKKDFISAYNVTGFKVQLTGQENQEGPVTAGMSPGKRPDESVLQYLSRVVNIDGESYEFGDQEYDVRFHPDTVMYYHST